MSFEYTSSDWAMLQRTSPAKVKHGPIQRYQKHFMIHSPIKSVKNGSTGLGASFNFVFLLFFLFAVVPLSLILVPYFHAHLPPYIHYSTVGTSIAKEILRSVTKAFEDKAMKCVPPSVDVFSNSSRMELLISSGGMQIAYHSMLTLSGSKAMDRLPGLNLSSTQIFFLVTAQELCSKSQYEGIETDSGDFHDM
jgi:hypothetical protein